MVFLLLLPVTWPPKLHQPAPPEALLLQKKLDKSGSLHRAKVGFGNAPSTLLHAHHPALASACQYPMRADDDGTTRVMITFFGTWGLSNGPKHLKELLPLITLSGRCVSLLANICQGSALPRTTLDTIINNNALSGISFTQPIRSGRSKDAAEGSVVAKKPFPRRGRLGSKHRFSG